MCRSWCRICLEAVFPVKSWWLCSLVTLLPTQKTLLKFRFGLTAVPWPEILHWKVVVQLACFTELHVVFGCYILRLNQMFLSFFCFFFWRDAGLGKYFLDTQVTNIIFFLIVVRVLFSLCWQRSILKISKALSLDEVCLLSFPSFIMEMLPAWRMCSPIKGKEMVCLSFQ